ICYDFDKTLSPKDMQDYGIIPKLKMKTEKFWSESNKLASEYKIDRILAYMKTIIKYAEKYKDEFTFSYNDFKTQGEKVELFNGVVSWFDRINEFASERNITLEHYIISAGLKEVIEGTKIANHFKSIFASSFHFDSYHKPVWPSQVVNFTQKTQYLFRISKDKLDLKDEKSVNEEVDSINRRIPFKNMIYIGDSDTDIPA